MGLSLFYIRHSPLRNPAFSYSLRWNYSNIYRRATKDAEFTQKIYSLQLKICHLQPYIRDPTSEIRYLRS